jgi:NADPH:quinone reductase-like Zn-dependent oxidoreductase
MAQPATMRAWRIHEYGGPEKLRLDTMPLPSPGEGDLLVKVAAASVNPIDWKMREGQLQRIYALKFPRILGRDCAGTVVESRSAAFKPGDRVVAVADAARDGTQAEYVIVPAANSARIPAGVSFEQSVAFGIAGTSAWIPLVDMAHVGPGMRVLVHGGAGGVGSVGVQLARHLGAEVFSTCSTRNVEHVKSLGAHRAIDYTREDFVQAASPCDVAFDTVGGETHLRSYAALKPGGLLVYISAMPIPAGAPPRDDVRVMQAQIRATTEKMEKQLELAARGVLKAQIGQVFAFAEAPKAYEIVQQHRARGKIVIAAG